MASGNKSSSRQAGLIERTVTRLLMRPARVSAVAGLSEHFRLIDFAGEALKGASWSPGDKVQIKLGGGFLTRTYTPIVWDGVTGETRILTYRNGAGPGSEWAGATTPGDERPLFGPHASIDLENLPASTLLFGDETSLGLAIALERSGDAAARRHYVFEVNDRDESAGILHRFGLQATLFQRQPDDGHSDELIRAILPFAGVDSAFVLSGKAASIQRLSRALKATNVTSRRIRAKVYWTPGMSGLD